MREADKRGEDLGLTEDEVAFYDALEANDSAVKVLGEPTLTLHRPGTGRNHPQKRHALTGRPRNPSAPSCASWSRRILRKYGYPPDKQEKATQTVLQQAELLCADWAS